MYIYIERERERDFILNFIFSHAHSSVKSIYNIYQFLSDSSTSPKRDPSLDTMLLDHWSVKS